MSDTSVLVLAAVIVTTCSALITWLLLHRFKPSQDALTRWGSIGLIVALVLLLVFLVLPE